jgi:hypothetical protein
MGTEASGRTNIRPDFLDNLVEAGGIEQIEEGLGKSIKVVPR